MQGDSKQILTHHWDLENGESGMYILMVFNNMKK